MPTGNGVHPRDTDDLDFDDENEAHLARNAITPTEVAEVFVDQPVFVPNKKGLAAAWLMLGDTAGGSGADHRGARPGGATAASPDHRVGFHA